MYYGESGDTLFKEEMEIIDDVINSDNDASSSQQDDAFLTRLIG